MSTAEDRQVPARADSDPDPLVDECWTNADVTAPDPAMSTAGPNLNPHAHESILDAAESSVGLSIDEERSEADSPFNNDTASSSKSVSSSVYAFVEEYGRRYHRYKEGKYYLPNDEQEQNRLDLQHTIALKLLDGRLFLAPINPKKVLDIGTGTGIWAIDLAEQYPEADVLGTDLSPIQPEYIPRNCRFEIEDVDDDWVYCKSFDFIHGRMMGPFVSDFKKMFKQIYDNLTPGGYVEFYETIINFQAIDGTLEGTALQKWNQQLQEGVKKSGRSSTAGLRFKRYMAEAGFIKIVDKRYPVPMNTWAKGKSQKMLGAMYMENILNGIDGLSLGVFGKVLGWPVEEIEAMLVDVKRDVQDKSIHAYVPITVTYGQKPL